MSIILRSTCPDDFQTLSRICHLAFNTLHEHHRVSQDVPTEEVGQLIIGGVMNRPDYVGIVAEEDGRILGSNFLLLADEVCGVGPITVDPTVQSRGVGRLLMRWAIDEARRRRGDNVNLRLFQEAINTTSLSLYTSLGFRWREAAALMLPKPIDSDDPTIREMVAGDLPELDRLSKVQFGFSRINDAKQLLNMKLPGFVKLRNGKVVGYQIATLFGHAAAESPEDLLALSSSTARHVPPPMAVNIVPMNQPVFALALSKGFRVAKVLNYMSLETYLAPYGNHFPSIQC